MPRRSRRANLKIPTQHRVRPTVFLCVRVVVQSSSHQVIGSSLRTPRFECITRPHRPITTRHVPPHASPRVRRHRSRPQPSRATSTSTSSASASSASSASPSASSPSLDVSLDVVDVARDLRHAISRVRPPDHPSVDTRARARAIRGRIRDRARGSGASYESSHRSTDRGSRARVGSRARSVSGRGGRDETRAGAWWW